MKDLILRKMTAGDIDDPVSSGILVELDAFSPAPPPPIPELNMAAYFLVSYTPFDTSFSSSKLFFEIPTYG